MEPLPLLPVAMCYICDTHVPARDLQLLLDVAFPFFISIEPPHPAPVPPAE